MKGLKKLIVPLVAGSLFLGSCQQDKIDGLESQIAQDSISISHYKDTLVQYSNIIDENDSTIHYLVESNSQKDSLVEAYKNDAKTLKSKLIRVQRQKRDLSRKLKKYADSDGTDINSLKKEYVKLENEYSKLQDAMIKKDSEVKYLKKEVERQNNPKWQAGDRPWNSDNKTKAPRYSKINGRIIEFKDNDGTDMSAYAIFGDSEQEVELRRVNHGFRGASFELPERKEYVESVTFYAVDRDGNKSKPKTLHAKDGFVYRKKVKQSSQ